MSENGSSDSYLVTQFVIEWRRTGCPWMTWPAVYPERIPDEPEARQLFVTALATRHDPARMQYRLVRRTAVITDEVLAEEREGRPGLSMYRCGWTETL